MSISHSGATDRAIRCVSSRLALRPLYDMPHIPARIVTGWLLLPSWPKVAIANAPEEAAATAVLPTATVYHVLINPQHLLPKVTIAITTAASVLSGNSSAV